MYRIVTKRVLNPTVSLMEIEAPAVARKAEPGQFIILRVDEEGERIPLTIADFDREKGTVTIIYQVVGATTEKLNHKEQGEFLQDFVGPLGRATETEGLKRVAVVGGGDVAVEDALFLARGCAKVYVIHRRDELRAAASLQERLRKCENVEFIWDTELTEITGEDHVDCLKIRNKKDGTERVLDVDGVFIAVGTIPNTGIITKLLQLDEYGYIRAGEDGKTEIPGIFAAGDIRTKQLRQIVTAVSDGANAITSVQEYLNTL